MASLVKGSSSSASDSEHNRSDVKKRRFFVVGRDVETMVILFVVISILVVTLGHFGHGDLRMYFRESSSVASESCPGEEGGDRTRDSQENQEKAELKKVLEKAVMEDKKTVIITILNAAWTEPNSTLDLFLESLRIGNQTQRLVSHFVFVTFDEIAYSRCLAARFHCYALQSDINLSGQKVFMSADYLYMMWRRLQLLGTVLELGYDFVFTDVDIMWLRNPFQYFYPDGDFQIACDSNRFGSTDRRNSPNCGFLYVKSNNRTIKFFKFWNHAQYYFPGVNEQDVLNRIKFSPFVDRVNMTMRFFNTSYISTFCEPSRDLDTVVTMHANCRVGLQVKLRGLNVVLSEWKRYMASPRTDPSESNWSVAGFP